MAPLEPWEKVLVNVVEFSQTEHGDFSCRDCHDGEDSEVKEEAHEGLVARPSEGEAEVCSFCHEDVTAVATNSLHFTQEGYWSVLEDRGMDRTHPEVQEMFGNHCASCHTSCGDCHVSQPASVGGGLLDGHLFTDNPPMTRTCTACHGSRVGNEYMGKNEGVLADLHFRQERMTCIDCHPGSEMHGEMPADSEGPPADHRYETTMGPRCESCHDFVGTEEDEVIMHQVHEDSSMLSCQVCHSTTYSNCDSCHVAVSETSGTPFFTTESTYFGFYIGQNLRQSEDRPYQYVPVRHVPVDTESFAFYGSNLLPNFDNEPTWKYATPHNIQRNTPQTESCNACHGNPELFLTVDKVNPLELGANQGVIVDTVPEER